MTATLTARINPVAGPSDITDPTVLDSWPTCYYAAVPNRAAVASAIASGDLTTGRALVDPLSTEGPHRSIWRLTGYRYVGTAADGTRVYIYRVSVNDTTRVEFFAAEVNPAGHLLVFAHDYMAASGKTLTAANLKATERVNA